MSVCIFFILKVMLESPILIDYLLYKYFFYFITEVILSEYQSIRVSVSVCGPLIMLMYAVVNKLCDY